MAGKTGPKVPAAGLPGPEDSIYLDASAFVKLYAPEPESETLDRFLVGRSGLIISELTITEVISAVSRRRREAVIDEEQADRICDAIFEDARSGSFRRWDLSPSIHRAAERILRTSESTPLRTLDALHIAIAASSQAKYLITFDIRMSKAAAVHGLRSVHF